MSVRGRGCAVAAVAILALAGCAADQTAGTQAASASAPASTPVSPPMVPRATVPPGTGRTTCDPRALRLSISYVSPETGERAFAIDMRNVGAPCSIIGYPRVRAFGEDGAALPMTYSTGGQYVTDRAPGPVELPVGGMATVVIAKYRCDVSGGQGYWAFEMALPGTDDFLEVPGAGVVYCGPDDRGDLVSISPVSPDVQAAVQ